MSVDFFMCDGDFMVILHAIATHCQQNLSSLKFFDCSLERESVRLILQECTNISELTLDSIPFVGKAISMEDSRMDGCFYDLLLPNMTTVDLSRSATDAMLVALSKACPNLQKLDCSEPINTLSAGVKAVTVNCQNLNTLSLRSSFFELDTVSELPNLTDLDLGTHPGATLTDATVIALVSKCKS